MRVQDLLLTALFLEDITEPLVVIRRRLYAFKGMAESKRLRASIGYRLGLEIRRDVPLLVARLRRCLQRITLLLKGIGLAQEMALCCRT
jgi:hypothetical protein